MSVRPTQVRVGAKDVDRRVVSRARRLGTEPRPNGTRQSRVDHGYLVQAKYLPGLSTVDIVDIPGAVYAVDAYGIGSRGYATSQYGAGPRAPWAPGGGYQAPEPEDAPEITLPAVPTYQLGVTSPVLGLVPLQGVPGDYSTSGLEPGSSPFAFINTRGGGANTPDGGFWRCQLEAAAQLYAEDFFPFGDPAARPDHWLSVRTGYTSRSTHSDVRISPAFVGTLAPGYTFQPATNGGVFTSGLFGHGGGTWPSASACRRRLNGRDLLAVSIPVAKTRFLETEFPYEVGESGLLVLLIEFVGGVPSVANHHLYKVQELDAAMTLVGYPAGSYGGEFYYFNNANMQSVVITDDETAVVYGAWATSRWTPLQDLGGNTEAGPGAVPFIHFYRAELTGEGATFTRQRTTVYDRADANYLGYLSFDDDPATPFVPFPVEVTAWLDEGGATHAVTMCRTFDRSLANLAGSPTAVLAGRNYLPTPVVAYCHDTDQLLAIDTVYHSTYRYIALNASYPIWSIFPPWFGSAVASTTKVIFVGFDRGPARAQNIRFVQVDAATGTVTSDPLPTVATGTDRYRITPRLTCYQQEVRDVDGVVTAPACFVLSYVTDTGPAGTPVAFVWQGTEWLPIPPIASTTGAMYLGNGYFGNVANLFDQPTVSE